MASARSPVTPVSRSNHTVSASKEASKPAGIGHRPVKATCGSREYGRSSGIDRQVDHLEVLHPAVEPPAVAEPREVRLAIEEGDARAIRPEAEVLEIAAVARVREIRVEAQPIGDIGAVRERRQPPVTVGEVVARQVVRVDLAATPFGQVAILDADAEAAPRQQERRQRQVVIRREVEVVRHAELEAALVGVPERREQEAGLAPVPDRERDHGREEDRYAFEVDAHVSPLALLRLLVDLDLGSPQFPVRVAGGAGREADLRQPQRAVTAHLERIRRAARRPLRQLEFRAGELSRAERVPASGPAFQAQVGRAVLDGALDLEALLRRVVGGGIGGDLALALDDGHAAGEFCIAFARHLPLAADDLDRLFARLVRLGARERIRGCGRRLRIGRPHAFAGGGRREHDRSSQARR